MTSTGYQHPAYVASLAAFGRPVTLPRSGGRALLRAIPGSTRCDAIGPYPLMFCDDWSALPTDLPGLPEEPVGFSVVTDPFARLDIAFLRKHFDIAIPFKTHFVADLTQPPETFVSKSHQASVRRALKKVDVQISQDPLSRLDDWVSLYAALCKRHGITGIRAFSRAAFAQQLAIPGMVAFEVHEMTSGDIVGMDLWYVQGDTAYGHLAAFSERGYQLRASYAAKWHVLKHFSGKLRYVHLSAAAGTAAGGVEDGLTVFKRGWSTGTLVNYFCGKILDAPAYDALVRARDAAGISLFPAYRKGEF